MAITRKDIIYFILTDRFYGIENQQPEVKQKIDKNNPLFYHGLFPVDLFKICGG